MKKEFENLMFQEILKISKDSKLAKKAVEKMAPLVLTDLIEQLKGECEHIAKNPHILNMGHSAKDVDPSRYEIYQKFE